MAKIAFEKLRFVVVDDNVHMRRIVRTLLRAFGSREIYEAEDGASGLEAVEAYSPDILITDIKMPIFDGIELTEMIRNPDGSKFPFLPIIVLSAYSEKNLCSGQEMPAFPNSSANPYQQARSTRESIM